MKRKGIAALLALSMVLAAGGTGGMKVLQKLTSVNLSEIPYYAFTTGEFAGQKDVIISNTGYTGAGGFELYFYPEAGDVKDASLKASPSLNGVVIDKKLFSRAYRIGCTRYFAPGDGILSLW